MKVLLGPVPCHGCGVPVTVVARPFAFEAPRMHRRDDKRRLTQEQADTLRRRHAAGESVRMLAREFGLSQTASYRIVAGSTYFRTTLESSTLTETVSLSADGSRHVCAESNARSVPMVYDGTDGSSVASSDTIGNGRVSARPRNAAVPCLEV